MTELETQLLNALKRLEQQFREQQQTSEQALMSLKDMYEHTFRENKALQHQVSNLSEQVDGLSKLIKN